MLFKGKGDLTGSDQSKRDALFGTLEVFRPLVVNFYALDLCQECDLLGAVGIEASTQCNLTSIHLRYTNLK
jgi:hypothetical protein